MRAHADSTNVFGAMTLNFGNLEIIRKTLNCEKFKFKK
jgi:hypothetical protein